MENIKKYKNPLTKMINLDEPIQSLLPQSYPLIWRKMQIGWIDTNNSKNIISNEINTKMKKKNPHLNFSCFSKPKKEIYFMNSNVSNI